ncbi:MAG TPA: bifunctional adenosylcobinamide kinase/adenosylcobinamide-phosphate guanylyltransferase [Alphaproteobacteria bacterium]
MGGGASLPRATLVLGGARSGKSAYAEQLIEGARVALGVKPLYIATAEARDTEMIERIRRHRDRRGDRWDTIEEPIYLSGALVAHSGHSGTGPGRPILVDCLTLWLSNLLLAGHDIAHEREQLAATIACLDGPVVLISNEVGLGIVPDNALARAFRDEAGLLNQAIAQVCVRVVFMAAGLPMVMKHETTAATGAAR